MTFPQSKSADKYNYEVAAYLKVKGLQELGSQFDLRESNIDPSPALISAKTTLFGINLSFDIIASTARWEFLIECKRVDAPRPMTKDSVQFKQAVVEFLSSYPLREPGYKEYKYLFISNADTRRLSDEVYNLKISETEDLLLYLEMIKDQAKKKWTNANTDSVNLIHLRSCLQDLIIKTIDLGELRSLEEDNEKFKEIRDQYYSEIGKHIQGLPPTISKRTKLALVYGDGDYFETKWNSEPVSISEEFIHVLSEITNKNTIMEIPFNSEFFTKMLRIVSDNELEQDKIDTVLSFSINNKLNEKNNQIVVISPSLEKLYLCNASWLCNESSLLKDADNRFNLIKISERLSLPFGGHLLRIAIQESYRLIKGGLYYTDEFFYE